jgi:uncharacterized protein
MLYIDPHIHCVSRTVADYEDQYRHGLRAVIEPAFWLGQPRTSVGTFVDYFNMILEWEPERASQSGLVHRCLIAMNPKEANDQKLADEVMELMPELLQHPHVLGVGETGYDAITPAEERAMIRHIEMALEFNLPLMVHTPHRDKARGTQRTMDVLKDMNVDPSRCLIDHSTEETTKMILEAGYWAGHTVYPHTKLTPDRFANIFAEFGVERMMVNSSADWGDSDPLNVPKTAMVLERRGVARAQIQQLVFANIVDFYGNEKFQLPAELMEEAGMLVRH